MKYIYLITVLICVSTGLFAQKNGTRSDLVIYKTGKRVWGEIQLYEPGKDLLIKTPDGVIMKVPAELIDRFVVGGNITNTKALAKPEQPFLQKGDLYNNFALFFPFGARITANSKTGLGFEYSLGMQIAPRLGVGLGTGMDFMFGGTSDRIVPMVAELRYYNGAQRRNRFYTLLDSGYGWGWSADRQIEGAYKFKGGWRVHPAIGAAWHSSNSIRFTTEFGFWHQRATLIEDWWETSRWRRENDYKLNRWVLKMGLLF